MRVFVSYQGHSVELEPGETIIGRQVGCQIRFNDPQVSRAHLRIIVEETRAELEDAGSRNGALLNGRPLRHRQQLRDGDRIQLGTREISVQILDSEAGSFGEETTGPAGPEALSAPRTPLAASAPVTARHACPSCREPVSVEDDACKNCHYSWGEFRPGLATKPHAAITQDLEQAHSRRRRHPRYPVDLPIVYSSESLELESVALDLSLGGVFIHTQVLDPVGTECAVTMLIDGAPAITLPGKVVRTVDDAGPDSAPGLGIEFEELSAGVQTWLAGVIPSVATRE